ncbi:MAG: GTP-binding protein [Anaerolineales bacterium]|nr:GTP-binding protein [Anaerolineales bacterium]
MPDPVKRRVAFLAQKSRNVEDFSAFGSSKQPPKNFVSNSSLIALAKDVHIIMEITIIQKKVCLLGSFAVGKTSLVRRFVYNSFEEKYLSTIGVAISRKQTRVNEGRIVSMIIWDLAGSDEFNGKHASYLQGAAGALLVCDLTRADTFTIIQEYYAKLKSVSPEASIVLIGNKTDIVAVSEESEAQIGRLAMQFNAPYLFTSAKAGVNVEECFQALAEQMINTSA